MIRRATIAATFVVGLSIASGAALAAQGFMISSGETTSPSAKGDEELISIAKTLECDGTFVCKANLKGRSKKIITITHVSCASFTSDGTAAYTAVTTQDNEGLAIVPVTSRSMTGTQEAAVSDGITQISIQPQDKFVLGVAASEGEMFQAICVLTGTVRKL